MSGNDTPVLRREDDRLVTGRGAYADDIRLPDALHAAFVRSPHASARVLGIDAAAALAMPGVAAVLTAAEMDADGIADYSLPLSLSNADGTTAVETPRPFLVRDRVRFLGEPLALVLAGTAALAQDAAEQVAVEYEELPAVTTVAEAAAPDAPLLWPDRAGNLAYHWRRGDPAAVEAALAASAHVVRLKLATSRVSAAPMEPRSALAYVDEAGRLTLRASYQSPHILRDSLAGIFGLGREEVRVIAADVGGSFGMKSGFPREEPVLMWAARRLGRPVRWRSTRDEAFLADDQGRDIVIDSALGLDADGRFTALDVRYDVNVGGYLSARSVSPIRNFGGIAGVYTTPVICGTAIAHFTNTQQTAPYRGAGRPDATYVIERLIDVAARELGKDPVELRRINMIPSSAMPYQTPFIFRYDCGEFERVMDRALEMAGQAGFAARRAEALARGRLRGLGIALPIEVAAGPVGKPATDFATVRANPDGTVTLLSGSMSVGQGHETGLPLLAAARLGIAPERVIYVQGDTAVVPRGKGNGGSSGLTLGGTAVTIGIDAMLEKARELASEELEASPLDIEYARGEFRIVGSDRSLPLGALAALAEAKGDGGLSGDGSFGQGQPTFPNACHVVEVEIDPETGELRTVSYVAVEDVGRVLYPALVEGQVHGGIAQGLGQALLEQIRYGEDGQLLTGSFMDYAMPRADDVPFVVGDHLEVPTALNPLGVKGVGEAGTVGAMAAVMNAVCDALAPLGIRHFDMPATPARLWQAISDAGGLAAIAGGESQGMSGLMRSEDA